MDNQITITDLAQIKTIIEVTSSRGAFQASEMRTVGELYDRLSAFLDSVVSTAKAETAADQADAVVGETVSGESS
jgi:hypothetical protein